ncbi:MAG: phosphoribosylformylglycinamidine cyclo-ligase [Bdellovibrionota bacterium]
MESNPNDKKLSYQQSGVHVEESDEFASWIQKSTKKSDRILDGIGGFASVTRMPFNLYQKPCLVTCTDGVGTKVLIASELGDLSTIGQDLVGMCVNDLMCTGGDPYFFLDYYAVGKFDKQNGQAFLKSVQRACEESNCDLVGGETAEMPGVYQPGHFDCAGFAIGLVDEDKRWSPAKAQAGDVLIALASSGFHSNGFSLLRKVFEGEWEKFRKELLEPTRLFVKPILDAKKNFEIHGAAHITGGGMDNLPRIYPPHLKAVINEWKFPEIFSEVQRRTGLSKTEMVTTLNCGIGMVLLVPPAAESAALEWGKKWNLNPWTLGRLEVSKSNLNESTWEFSK